MGTQGKQAVGLSVASSSWQPWPCHRQWTAPGGGGWGGRDSRAVPASASPTAWQPLISPHQPHRWVRARGRWHQSAGEPVPGLSSQARCGRARLAVPSVCSAPPDGGAGVSPGTAAPPAPAKIFIARVVRRLTGFTIFGICHSQSWAPVGRQAGEHPSTQMNTGKPSPWSWYLYSQSDSRQGWGPGERGRQSPASPGGDPLGKGTRV